MNNTDNISTLSATLTACDAEIAHLEYYLVAAGRAFAAAGTFIPDDAQMSRQVAEVRTRLETLKYQTRGNILVDLRLAVEAA